MPTNKELLEKNKTLREEIEKLQVSLLMGDGENDDINRRWAEDNERHQTVIECQQEEIEFLKKELYLFKDKPQLGRSYANSRRENKELKEEIENLKDQNKEDLDDYQLFLDAFDVAHATEAIDWYWKHLTDESKDSLIKKGHNPNKKLFQ